jgi:nicotinate-nucleotide adenylyltransferase
MDNQLDGNTIHLLPLLPKEHTYHFVIGSDQLPTFHLWGEWQQLLKEIPFFVFPRLGYPNDPLYEGMTMINDSSLVVSNISSTKIRDRVRRGLSIEPFVPPGVGEYIRTHNLYQEG